jgi:hypothetical protein
MPYLKLNKLTYSWEQSVNIEEPPRVTTPVAKSLRVYLGTKYGLTCPKEFRNEPSSISNYKLKVRGSMPTCKSSQSRRIK